MRKGARKAALITGGGLLLAAALGAYVWHESHRLPVFELYVFDTPGMPSIFIRTEDDRRILVNGGASSDIVHRLTGILPFYSRRIDEIVAVNDDPRNVTGLIEVLNRYDVHAVSVGNATSTDSAFAVFKEALDARGIEPHLVSNGDRIASTSLYVYDEKKSVFAFRAGQIVLLVPFNLTVITKRMLAETEPDYIVYSAQVQKKPAAKPKKPDTLAGILMDRRYNVREAGTIKMTVRDGRLEIGNVED